MNIREFGVVLFSISRILDERRAADRRLFFPPNTPNTLHKLMTQLSREGLGSEALTVLETVFTLPEETLSCDDPRSDAAPQIRGLQALLTQVSRMLIGDRRTSAPPRGSFGAMAHSHNPHIGDPYVEAIRPLIMVLSKTREKLGQYAEKLEAAKLARI